MTNAVLKAILAEYGTRVRAIRLNNNVVQINQKVTNIKMITNDDIVYKTFAGEDFFEVPIWDSRFRRWITQLLRTAEIKAFLIAEKDTDYVDTYMA